MLKDLKERYNNNKKFQRNLWDVKVFADLSEKQEIILKVIYFLDNVFKEDLKNICFYLLGDDAFETNLRKLRDEGYINWERKKLGTIYSITNKSIQALQPFTQNHKDIKIKDKQLYINKIKGGIVAKQLNEYLLDILIDSFNKQGNYKERYIFDQFIKNFSFKDFLQKDKEGRMEELEGLDEKDLNRLLKTKTYNDKAFLIYYRYWIKDYKTIQGDRYILFRNQFIQSLQNPDENLRYYLKDFSKKLYSQTWNEVVSSFMEEEDDYKNEYITKQFIKHREYKRISKRDGDELNYLLKLGFNKEEITNYFNLEEVNRIEILYSKIIEANILNQSSLQLFKEHFYNVIKKGKTRYHSDYLGDYKKEKFLNIDSTIINYFKEMDNNYLKDSNRKALSSLNKCLKALNISNENLIKTNRLENENSLYTLLSYCERGLKKQRNDLAKKEINDLIAEKNKELQDIQQVLNETKKTIQSLENDLSFRLLTKENGEQEERAFTFKVLEQNSIFIDNVELKTETIYGKELGKIKVGVSFLDNTENGLQPYLIFNRMFIVHTFLTQLINREGILDLHINLYTFNENRKQLLEERIGFVKDKMKGYGQAFGNLQDQITIEDTTMLNLKLWEFYNQVKFEIEESIN